MKAIILCDDKLDDLYDKNIFFKFEKKDVVIVTTESNLYQEVKKKYPSWNSEFVYIYGECKFEQSKEMSEFLINEVKKRINNPSIRDIVDISINGVYEIYTRVIVQVEKAIDDLIEKYNIDEIYLYGGNKKVPYFPLNMAEGERPFRFMYKRRWFLNSIINDIYKNNFKIIWQQELSIVLKGKRWLRLLIMNGGKIYKSSRKYIKAQRVLAPISKEEEYIGLVVRTKNQVKSINSIYREIKKNTRFKPFLLAYENYANNDLTEAIAGNDFEYIDVRQYANVRKILSCFCKVEFYAKEKANKSIALYKDISVNSRYISKEMKFQWWDALLFWESLSAIKERAGVNLRAIVNIETYNWVAAIQAKWANSKKVPIYSVQFVTLDLRPHIIWVDKFFFMTKSEYEKCKPLVEQDVCAYIGPICYDDIYEKTQHESSTLNNILILTQPDSLQKDSIRIIDDVIKIRSELERNWNICIKLHPRENNPEYFYKEYKKYNFIRVIFDEINSTDLIISSDLAIGIVSTTLYQSVLIGTPAISVNYEGVTNYILDVVEAGVVKKIINYKAMKSYIIDYEFEEKNFYLNRKRYLEKNLGKYEGKGAETFAVFLNSTL